MAKVAPREGSGERILRVERQEPRAGIRQTALLEQLQPDREVALPDVVAADHVERVGFGIVVEGARRAPVHVHLGIPGRVVDRDRVKQKQRDQADQNDQRDLQPAPQALAPQPAPLPDPLPGYEERGLKQNHHAAALSGAGGGARCAGGLRRG